ncbi:MAG: type IV pilus assembly protein PilM [Candidatus Binatia bacterium]
MAPPWKMLNLGFLSPFQSKDGFVALDIGSSSIKLAETAFERNGFRLCNLGISPLPPDSIQQNMVVEPAPLIEAVRGLIKEHGVSATKVICAVPGRAVIMKKIQMPRQTDQELETNIEFEANNVIPENLANVNLDYQVLNLLDGGNKMEVLLVAVKKEIVNSYAEVIEGAGLSPAVIDVDYFAMENMYEANYAPQPGGGMVGLIHMGARYTSVTLLENGYSTFTGDLTIGGEEFTETLKRELNVSNEAAEAAKVRGSLDGQVKLDLETLLKPAMEDIVDEIRRTVSLYGTVGATEGEGLKHIYLSGGGAKVPGLCGLLEQKLGIPISLTDPFRGFAVHKNIDKNFLSESASLFAVAAGLSIRRPGDK